MQKNMGSGDKVIRFALAAVLIGLGVSGTISGVWAIVAYVVAAVFIVTSVVSFCPAYLPFGISTCKRS